MQMKRFFCMVVACATAISCLSMNTGAVSVKESNTELVIQRATGQFNMDVSANSLATASSSFPLEAGETVRINASYSPDASMDFGLIDSDGRFHYLNVTTGSIDKTIRIEEHGNYTFAVRNNSAKTVTVSGFVRY